MYIRAESGFRSTFILTLPRGCFFCGIKYSGILDGVRCVRAPWEFFKVVSFYSVQMFWMDEKGFQNLAFPVSCFIWPLRYLLKSDSVTLAFYRSFRCIWLAYLCSCSYHFKNKNFSSNIIFLICIYTHDLMHSHHS